MTRQAGFGHYSAGAIAGTLLALASPATAAAPASADLILTNAQVYTVEAKRPWAQAVAVSGGKIVAVGSARDVMRRKGAATRVVDLGGRLLMPAFGDGHIHPMFGGLGHARCPLHSGKSIEAYKTLIAACLAKTPGTGVLFGGGWDETLFPGNSPRKEILDAVSRDRPLVFESSDGHSMWVNSAALTLAGITKDTPDPAGGKIARDPATGEPSGGLHEDSAMKLVEKLVPLPSPIELENAILYTLNHVNSLGITNWHDASVEFTDKGESAVIDAYAAVQKRGALSAHVVIDLKWKNEKALDQIPSLLLAADHARSVGITARSVKYYLDGVIPQKTALMIAPYANSGDEKGKVQIAPGTLDDAVSTLDLLGLQAHFHAIGDGAVREALDSVAAARKRNGMRDTRPMISHLNVIDPTDQPRFGKLGVTALFQPLWSSNYVYMDQTKQAIGPVRSGYIYPAGSILKSGGRLAYGADWPVASANPLEGIQVAITRTTPTDPESGPLLPKEGITIEQAVAAYTINVAYVNHLDKDIGSIAPGKSADLIVLDRNIFTIPVTDISKAKVLVTMFRGSSVFGTLEDFGLGGAAGED